MTKDKDITLQAMLLVLLLVIISQLDLFSTMTHHEHRFLLSHIDIELNGFQDPTRLYYILMSTPY